MRVYKAPVTMWEESDGDMKTVVKDNLHMLGGGGGGVLLWELWGDFVAASDGNISERLKSVDILERFKAVIFQSGGSLC